MDRTAIAVTGLLQLLKLETAFKNNEGGRTASEVREFTIDFRLDSRATFEKSGEGLGRILALCNNLETLEIVLPGPGVEGEEVAGLPSLAIALTKVGGKVSKFILRSVPEMKRNRDGTRKFAVPLVLPLRLLSPFVLLSADL